MNFVSVRSYSTFNTVKKSAKLIRNEFLDYFKNDLEHTVIRSSPVTPLNDQTLAFVNAGMNQFKGIFLGYYDPPAVKVASSQKCIRISGKHNDLNVVGNDTYHHTFFEMLGNWSFGDYFKEEACRYAWDLLTKHYGIKKELLYVTYFAGDETLGLEPDLECKDIWLRIGVPKDKILSFGVKDNFWEMGVSGPCGPCTEIHVDRTKQEINHSARINKDHADLTELWNIVFIQYERLANGSIVSLPKHHVDTGMGFERLVSLLQDKTSNYDTDIFQPHFEAIQKYTKAPKYSGKFRNDESGLDTGYRILADHSRMIAVALADGMVPEESNKLRKIIRKVIDVGEKVFRKQGLLSELSYSVADNLGDVYPELRRNLKKVQCILEFEEELFKKLRSTSGKEWKKIVQTRPELTLITEWMTPGLVSGYKYLQSTLQDLEATKKLSGNVAFKLYDTYGLSVETIIELAQIESLHFDEDGFLNKLENAKFRSRIGLEKTNEISLQKNAELLEKSHIPKTNDSFKYNYTFSGSNYQFPTVESKIVGLIVNDHLILKSEISDFNTKPNDEYEIGIILDKTLCYSLEGGQTSDKGYIRIKDLIFNINNVRKINGYVVHFGKFAQSNSKNLGEEVKVGDSCVVSLDPEHRIGTMQHHTGTHMLNACLNQVMRVVYSRNSFILPHVLNFQCNSFGEKMSLEQLKTIENYINRVIEANVPITTKILNSLELLAENSVTLVPGEVYPYTGIRVVEIESQSLSSKEACCGTHVHETGVLQHFCVLSYSSKGASNFTIKAVVGLHAVSAKSAGENVQHKILSLEQELKDGKITYELFKSIREGIETEISDSYKNLLIPYLIKEECLVKLKNLDKNIWIQAKEREMFAVRTDINATNSTNMPIVHCLYNNPTYLSLHEIVSVYPDIPILIILCHNGTVRARCSVPQNIVSDTFNAQIWMKIILETFNAEYGPNKGFNSLLFANMKSTVISENSSEHLIQKAVEAAKNLAFVSTKQN